MYMYMCSSPCPAAVGVISETIRKVTTARSLKNIKTAQVVTLTATHRAITLMDPTNKKSIGQVHVHAHAHAIHMYMHVYVKVDVVDVLDDKWNVSKTIQLSFIIILLVSVLGLKL